MALNLRVLQVSLALFAVGSLYSTVDAVGYVDHPYHFQPPKLPKPDFEFTFYMQSRIGNATNSTAYTVTLPVDRVDQVTLTDQSWFQSNTSLFGTIGVFENPLTLESPSNSTEVGLGRGIFVFDRKFDPAFAPAGSNGVEWLWTGIFNDNSGLGNSTLCFKGWNLERDSVTAASLKHDAAIFVKA
ncbi:hypothetical protein R1sor_008097 [Riccia sorocarpa]|uniref:Dirigent protein n=1 Tax=Riccia sorocarpa TaxID=122646 RepID=A0ABD3HUK1_9MARC